MDGLTELFDHMKMPEDCVRRIGRALENSGGGNREEWTVMKKPAGRNFGWLAAAAVCLVLVLAAGMLTQRDDTAEQAATAPTGAAETTAAREKKELEREKERLQEILESKNAICEGPELRDGRVYLTYNGQAYDITGGISEEEMPEAMARARENLKTGLTYTEGNVTYRFQGEQSGVEYDDGLHTPFTEVVDGRVYFTANGEYLDITEKFSEEEPFTYIFTDRHFLIHFIAIGGTVKYPGYLEMVCTPWGSGFSDCVSGNSCDTWDSEANARYGWEQRAKEIFEPYGVYWTS